MTDPTVAQSRYLDMPARERTTRGLMLYNRECARIHEIEPDVWAVPSSQGGYWRVDLSAEVCPCEDFAYACTDRDTGEATMNCKHIVAAAIARAKRPARPCLCYDGWHFMTYLAPDEPGGDEVEHTYRVPCRRCKAAR
jgi:hypothetical protein